MMQYKGYSGKIEFDDESRVLHGEVLGIRDVVTFQGTSVDEVEQAFRDSVDDYIAFCRDRGEEPDKPYSGRFVVRLSPETHRQAAILADAKGTSLNALVAECVEAAVTKTQQGDTSRSRRSARSKTKRRGKKSTANT